MIADGENRFSVNVQCLRQVGKCGAFAVVAMAKAEIDHVALMREIGAGGFKCGDELEDALHFSFVAGNDAVEVGSFVHRLCAGFAFEPIFHHGEMGAGFAEELFVVFVTGFVPRQPVEPTVPRRFPAVDFALVGDDEVWSGTPEKEFDSFDRVPEGTSGIDDPTATPFLKTGQGDTELGREGHSRIMIDQRPVEVGADECNGKHETGDGSRFSRGSERFRRENAKWRVFRWLVRVKPERQPLYAFTNQCDA